MRRLRHILTEGETLLVEVLLGLCAVGWACVVVLAPPSLFTQGVYAPMGENADQWVWALFFSATGALKLSGVWWRWQRVRMTGGAIGTFVWTFLAAMFALGGAPSGPLVYGLFALASLHIMIRHAKRWGTRERIKANGGRKC